MNINYERLLTDVEITRWCKKCHIEFSKNMTNTYLINYQNEMYWKNKREKCGGPVNNNAGIKFRSI